MPLCNSQAADRLNSSGIGARLKHCSTTSFHLYHFPYAVCTMDWSAVDFTVIIYYVVQLIIVIIDELFNEQTMRCPMRNVLKRRPTSKREKPGTKKCRRNVRRSSRPWHNNEDEDEDCLLLWAWMKLRKFTIVSVVPNSEVSRISRRLATDVCSCVKDQTICMDDCAGRHSAVC